MFAIRHATLEDFDGISQVLEEVDALHRDALPYIFRMPPALPARSLEEVAEMLNDSNHLVLVAVIDSQIVGVNIAELRSAPDMPIMMPRQYVSIGPIAVSSAFQAQGIGKALMDRVINWATEKQITQVELNVFEFNQKAIAFYEHLGFTTLSRKMQIQICVGNTIDVS